MHLLDKMHISSIDGKCVSLTYPETYTIRNDISRQMGGISMDIVYFRYQQNIECKPPRKQWGECYSDTPYILHRSGPFPVILYPGVVISCQTHSTFTMMVLMSWIKMETFSMHGYQISDSCFNATKIISLNSREITLIHEDPLQWQVKFSSIGICKQIVWLAISSQPCNVSLSRKLTDIQRKIHIKMKSPKLKYCHHKNSPFDLPERVR